jgi:hypothetical protein
MMLSTVFSLYWSFNLIEKEQLAVDVANLQVKPDLKSLEE